MKHISTREEAFCFGQYFEMFWQEWHVAGDGGLSRQEFMRMMSDGLRD